jgi:hypothetical protein
MPASFPRLIWLVVFAASLALAGCAHDPQASPASESGVERASTDDCAVLVAIGKSELKWGAKPPAAALLASFSMPSGAIYRQECSWRKLGVAAPVIGDSRAAMVFFVTRPTYAGRRATAYFQYAVAPVRLPDGSLLSPFLERELCSLEKQPAGWHLLGCRLTGMKP